MKNVFKFFCLLICGFISGCANPLLMGAYISKPGDMIASETEESVRSVVQINKTTAEDIFYLYNMPTQRLDFNNGSFQFIYYIEKDSDAYYRNDMTTKYVGKENIVDIDASIFIFSFDTEGILTDFYVDNDILGGNSRYNNQYMQNSYEEKTFDEILENLRSTKLNAKKGAIFRKFGAPEAECIIDGKDIWLFTILNHYEESAPMMFNKDGTPQGGMQMSSGKQGMFYIDNKFYSYLKSPMADQVFLIMEFHDDKLINMYAYTTSLGASAATVKNLKDMSMLSLLFSRNYVEPVDPAVRAQYMYKGNYPVASEVKQCFDAINLR